MVLLYMSTVSSMSSSVLVSEGAFWLFSATGVDDSTTSASSGNRSSSFASHSWINVVRGSVVKNGWWKAI